jgi:hypothetical protein
VAVGELVVQLVAADGDLVGVDDDDEVTTVDIRCERRLVLTALVVSPAFGVYVGTALTSLFRVPSGVRIPV